MKRFNRPFLVTGIRNLFISANKPQKLRLEENAVHLGIHMKTLPRYERRVIGFFFRMAGEHLGGASVKTYGPHFMFEANGKRKIAGLPSV